MKALLALLPFALLAANAEARDSTWLLCNNSGLALSTLEHRASIDDRATELTLIYGAHVYTGTLTGADAGLVKLEGRTSSGSVFNGKVTIDYVKKLATVRGELVINGAKFAIAERMSCKTLEGKL